MTEQELSTAELQAMTLTAATELASRWISEVGDKGSGIRPHLISGAGIELLVQLTPVPAIGMRLVDSDGSCVPLRSFVLG